MKHSPANISVGYTNIHTCMHAYINTYIHMQHSPANISVGRASLVFTYTYCIPIVIIAHAVIIHDLLVAYHTRREHVLHMGVRVCFMCAYTNTYRTCCIALAVIIHDLLVAYHSRREHDLYVCASVYVCVCVMRVYKHAPHMLTSCMTSSLHSIPDVSMICMCVCVCVCVCVMCVYKYVSHLLTSCMTSSLHTIPYVSMICMCVHLCVCVLCIYTKKSYADIINELIIACHTRCEHDLYVRMYVGVYVC